MASRSQRPFLQAWLGSFDIPLVVAALGLTVFGLIILLSATGPVAIQRYGSQYYFLKHQLVAGVIPGIAGMLLALLVPFRFWKKTAPAMLVLSIVLLILVFLPGIGAEINGAKGWLKLGTFMFQPSELVKLTFLLYLSAWLAERKGSDAHNPTQGLTPFLSALGAVALLLILQPDTGSMAIIVGTAMTLYFLSGAPVSWFLGMCVAGGGALLALIKHSPYRAARFMTFMHPELDPKGVGYHINQAFLAIGSGGWFGLGYGHSRQKFLYLPEVESDSLIAVYAEELGWVMVVLLLCAFGYLLHRCLLIARASEDRFGMYLASGVVAWLACQILLNMGSMTGLLPMTGVTLPFFSHGGSAMTVLLITIGIVARIPTRTSIRTL